MAVKVKERTRQMIEETKSNTEETKLVPLKEGALLDPDVQTEHAIKAAKALTALINNSSNPPVDIQGNKYLLFEHWQTLARFFNLSVGSSGTEVIMRDGKFHGYDAKAVVYDVNGVIIGSAEASCMVDEKNWKSSPEFQLKSMAQTRANAKALRNVLGWVAVLDGYKTTPAEEMDGVKTNNGFSAPKQTPNAPVASATGLASVKQIDYIDGLCKQKGRTIVDLEAIVNKKKESWTPKDASAIIGKLLDAPAAPAPPQQPPVQPAPPIQEVEVIDVETPTTPAAEISVEDIPF